MSLPPLVVGLDLDTGKFFSKVDDAKKGASDLAKSFESANTSAKRFESGVHSLGGSFQSTVITMGALRFMLMDINDIMLSFPKGVAGVAGEFEKMQTLMRGLSKEADEARKSLEATRDVQNILSQSKNAPFDIKAITDAYVRLKSVGIDPATGGLDALINSLAKAGGSSEQLKRISVAVAQMVSKSVISMEELRQQLGEALPGAMAAMARGMGLSMQQLNKAVGKGMVESLPAIAKMMAQLELESRGAAEAMMKTLPGAIERLSTEYTLFQRVVADQGFMTALRTATQELTAFFQSAQGQDLAVNVGKGLAELTRDTIILAEWLAKNVDLIKAIGVALVSMYGGSKLASAIGDPIVARMKAAEAAAAQERALIDKILKAEQNAASTGLATVKDKIADELRAHEARKDARIAQIKSELDAEVLSIKEQKAQLADLQRARTQAAAVANSTVKGSALTGGGTDFTAAVKAEAARRAADNEIAVVDRLIDASKRRIAAINNELAAMDKRQFATSKVAKALEDEATAHRTNIANLESAIARNGVAASTFDRLAGGVKAAGLAVVEFGKSFAMTSLYAAAFYVAIETATALFDRMTQSARDAKAAKEAALQVDEGRANQTTVDELGKQRQNALDSIGPLQRKKQLAEINTFGKNGFMDPTTPAEYARQIQSLRDQVSSLDSSIARAKSQVEQNSSDAIVETSFREIKTKIEQSTASIAAQAVDVKRQIDQAAENNSPESVTKPLREQAKQLGADYRRAQLAAIDGFIDGEGKELGKRLNTSQLTQLTDRLKKEREGISTQLQQILNVGMQPGKQPKVRTSEPADPLKEFLTRENQQLAVNKANALAYQDGVLTTKEIWERAQAQIDSMLVDGKLDTRTKDGKLRAPNPQEQMQAVTVLAEQQLAAQATKAEQAVARANQAMQASKAQLAEAARDDGTLDKSGKQGSWALGIIADLEKWKPALEQAGINFKDFVAGLKRDSAQVDATKVLGDLNEKIRKQADDLMVDDRARERERARIVIEAETQIVQARIDALRKVGNASADSEKQIEDLQRKLAVFTQNQNDITAQKTKTPIEKMADQWRQATQAMQESSVQWSNNLVDQLVENKLKIGQFVTAVLTDIAKIKLKEALAGSLSSAMGSLQGWASNALGMGSGAASAAGLTQQTAAASTAGATMATSITAAGTTAATEMGTGITGGGATASAAFEAAFASGGIGLSSAMGTALTAGGVGLTTELTGAFTFGTTSLVTQFISAGEVVASMIAAATASGSAISTGAAAAAVAFADGGVMTQFGSVPLRKYANGGIANRPQVALYGEGAKPEAYVPLPDGRTIPVTMSGGGSAGAAPNVTVNVINQSGQAVGAKQQGQPRFDGKQLILDVVLSAVSQPGDFRTGMRENMK